MGNLVDIGLRIVFIGIGATAVMDLWFVVLKILNAPRSNFSLLGRWVGHIFHGRLFHSAIAKSAPIKCELLIGWFTHYVIGIGFAGLLVMILGASWMTNPTFPPAISMGIATVIAPLLIMQPAMGLGVASSKTATPFLSCFRSVINHAIFGCGLYLAALASI